MRINDSIASNLTEDFYKTDSLEEGCKSKETVKKISELLERPEIYTVYHNRSVIPEVGECLLINEKECSSFSREHGGRYQTERCRRYFGKVVEIHPHVIVMKTNRGFVSERVDDFKVGLVKYVRLKQFPECVDSISYDDRLLGTFIKSFESLLEE